MQPFSITCPYCPASTTRYLTQGNFESHRLDAHERPVDIDTSTRRLEAESTTVGRARLTPWARDFTHWHRERISNRGTNMPQQERANLT